jgi:phosphocarrier protein HPr
VKRVRTKIVNELGLHARPAAEFVRLARTFQSEIRIVKEDASYSASSILEVLTANLDYGSVITLEADGPDAEEALKQLVALIKGFREREEQEAKAGK